METEEHWRNTGDWTLPGEEWQAIEGYEGLYEVSDLGRVRSVKTETVRAQHTTRGYPSLNLCRGGRHRSKRVHRLVAQAFMDAPEAGRDHINHINGDKTDNRLQNLEWVSPGENNRHAADAGLNDQRGRRNNRAKLTAEDVLEMRERAKRSGVTQRDLAAEFGVSQPQVGRILRRERWDHI